MDENKNLKDEFEDFEDIMDFDWNDVPGDNSVPPEDKEEKDSDVDDNSKTEKDEEEEIIDDWDDEDEDNEDDIDEDEEKDKDKKEDKKKKKSTNEEDVVIKKLKEIGLIDNEEEVDATDIKDVIEEKIEKEVNDRILAWAERELDEDAKAFIKFKKKGGKTEDFFKEVKKFADITNGNIEDEEFQEKVIRKALEEEGWDEEEIEDRLIFLHEKGKLEKIARKYYDKFKKKREETLKKLEKEQEKRQEYIEQQEREYKRQLKSILAETEDFYGVKIPARERTKLYSFINSNDVELEDGTRTTKFRLKLLDVFKEPKKLITLAYLLDKDLDLSKIDLKKGAKKPTGKKKDRKIADLDDMF